MAKYVHNWVSFSNGKAIPPGVIFEEDEKASWLAPALALGSVSAYVAPPEVNLTDAEKKLADYETAKANKDAADIIAAANALAEKTIADAKAEAEKTKANAKKTAENTIMKAKEKVMMNAPAGTALSPVELEGFHKHEGESVSDK